MLQFALRLGRAPRSVRDDDAAADAAAEDAAWPTQATVTTRAATADNADNLAPTLRRRDDAALCRHARSAGRSSTARSSRTRGRACGGATGSRRSASPSAPELAPHRRRGRSAGDGDGDVGCLRHRRRRPRRATAARYVLADRTLQGREPHVWARAAIAAYHDFQADRIVAEVNQGGDLVVDGAAPDRRERAGAARCARRAASGCAPSRSRRSTPRAASRTSARFDALEDQMCAFGADGLSRGPQPRPRSTRSSGR